MLVLKLNAGQKIITCIILCLHGSQGPPTTCMGRTLKTIGTMGVGDRADMNNKKHKAPTINQEEVHYDSYSKDDGSRDNERPAPATITVRPEGRDDSAQDVTN